MIEFLFICCVVYLFFYLIHIVSIRSDEKIPYKQGIAHVETKPDSNRVAPDNSSEAYRIIEHGDTVNNYFKDEDDCGCIEINHDKQNKATKTRKHAKHEIEKFIDVEQKTPVIVFDVETNGLHGRCSVLSCSAIKFYIDPKNYEMTEAEHFNRYYYPVEQFDPQAIAVNGLTKEVITEKRQSCTYPEYFRMDSDFEIFCGDTERFVAHNISFDAQFIPFIRGKKKFCTMITNTDIVAVEFLQWRGEWKWPKLSETANYYDIPFDENDLHNSMCDTEITAHVFLEMLKAVKRADNITAVEIAESYPSFCSHYNFTWQLRNINEIAALQCNIGDDVNLIKNSKTDNNNYFRVVTKSNECLGDAGSSEIRYYNIIGYDIDHGSEVLAKIRHIHSKDGRIEFIKIHVSIGHVNEAKHERLFAMDKEAEGIIKKAYLMESTSYEEAVLLYRKAMAILVDIDQECEKHFSTWRQQKFPINRLSIVLKKQRKYKECIEEIEAYEKLIDKIGLYKGEKEALEKRRKMVLKMGHGDRST